MVDVFGWRALSQLLIWWNYRVQHTKQCHSLFILKILAEMCQTLFNSLSCSLPVESSWWFWLPQVLESMLRWLKGRKGFRFWLVFLFYKIKPWRMRPFTLGSWINWSTEKCFPVPFFFFLKELYILPLSFLFLSMTVIIITSRFFYVSFCIFLSACFFLFIYTVNTADCPEQLCCLYHQWFSKPGWIKIWVIWSDMIAVPALGRR